MSVDSGQKPVNTPFNFSATIYFSEPLPSPTSFYLTVYVNNREARQILVSVPSGRNMYTASFQLEFAEPGTYSVKVEAPDTVSV